MKTHSLTPHRLHLLDAYWRAANYLSVGQIYLAANRWRRDAMKRIRERQAFA